MQKKIIALAVAGLVSGAAFAQSNVTIYGVIDAGYAHSSSGDTNGTDSTFNGINSSILSGSRIGFKGEEALGKGMKTVWVLEYGIANDVNHGIGTALARQSYVGLDFAGIGTFTLGRQYAPGFYASVRNDIMDASASAAPLNLMSQRAGNTIYAGTAGRIDNSINYKSPTWSGFSAQAMYSFGEASGATASAGTNGMYALGLNYANGPINLDAVYHNRQNRNAAAAVTGAVATNDNISEWMLGGTYDFKIAKLYATWQRQNDDNGTSATEADNSIWSLGVTAPVFGNGTIHAGYSKLSWKSTGADDSDAWAFGYTHALSKRTTLYTTYSHVDNDNNARQAAGLATTRSLDESHRIITAGIRHSF